MRVFGMPNQVVNTWQGKGARKKIAVLFKFDENGEHEIDENSISEETLNKIKTNFRVEEYKPQEKKRPRKKEV